MANDSRKNDERIIKTVDDLSTMYREHAQETKHMIDTLEKHESREIAILERIDRNFSTQIELIRSISAAQITAHDFERNRVNRAPAPFEQNNKLIITLVIIAVAAASGTQFVGVIIKALVEVLK